MTKFRALLKNADRRTDEQGLLQAQSNLRVVRRMRGTVACPRRTGEDGGERMSGSFVVFMGLGILFTVGAALYILVCFIRGIL